MCAEKKKIEVIVKNKKQNKKKQKKKKTRDAQAWLLNVFSWEKSSIFPCFTALTIIS